MSDGFSLGRRLEQMTAPQDRVAFERDSGMRQGGSLH
jgi:hypothetical protein